MHIDRRARLSALDDATTLVHRDPEPLKTFDVPILIMHGDDDQILVARANWIGRRVLILYVAQQTLPIDGSARLSAKLLVYGVPVATRSFRRWWSWSPNPTGSRAHWVMRSAILISQGYKRSREIR
jgi:hypothetical protein